MQPRSLSPRKARRQEIGALRMTRLRQRFDEIHSQSSESVSSGTRGQSRQTPPISRSHSAFRPCHKSGYSMRPVRLFSEEPRSIDSENETENHSLPSSTAAPTLHGVSKQKEEKKAPLSCAWKKSPDLMNVEELKIEHSERPRLQYSMQELMDIRDVCVGTPTLCVSDEYFRCHLQSDDPISEDTCLLSLTTKDINSSDLKLNAMDSCIVGRRKSEIDRVKSTVPGYQNAKIFLEYFDAEHRGHSSPDSNQSKYDGNSSEIPIRSPVSSTIGESSSSCSNSSNSPSKWRDWDTSETRLLRTPDWRDLSLSRRRFQGQMSAWRRALHKFDLWSPPPQSTSLMSPCIVGLRKLKLNCDATVKATQMDDDDDVDDKKKDDEQDDEDDNDEPRVTPLFGGTLSMMSDPTVPLALMSPEEGSMDSVSPIQSYRKKIGFEDTKTPSSEITSVTKIGGSRFSPTPPSMSRSVRCRSAARSDHPSWRDSNHRRHRRIHRGFSLQRRADGSSTSSSSDRQSSNSTDAVIHEVSPVNGVCHWNWRKSESKRTADPSHWMASPSGSLTMSSTAIDTTHSTPKEASNQRQFLKMYGYFSPITTKSSDSNEEDMTYMSSSVDRVGSASQQRMSPVMICTSADESSVNDVTQRGRSSSADAATRMTGVSPLSSTPSQMCSIEAEYRRMMKVKLSDDQIERDVSKSPAWCLNSRITSEWLAPHGSSSSPSPSPSVSPSFSKCSFARSLGSYQSEAKEMDSANVSEEDEDAVDGDAPVKLVSVSDAVGCLRDLLAANADLRESLESRLTGQGSDDPHTEGFLALLESELHKL